MFNINKYQTPEVAIAEYSNSNNYTQYVVESTNNTHTHASALEKYLVDTIEESMASIDKALSIKDLD